MPLRELIRRKGLLTVILALVAIGGVAACDGDPAHGGGGVPSPVTGAWETLATPTFDPPQGTFASAPRVTISAGAGATIRYTLDGSTPNASSSMYVSPLSIARTATLKAMAFKPGWGESAVQSGTYTVEIPLGTVEPVQFEPNAGDFANDVAVGLSSKTEGAALCYTLDGSTPTCDGGRCGGCSTSASATPVEITQTDQRIRAIACKSGMVPSSETYADYTLTAAKPVFDPAPDALDLSNPVAITSATRGAEIHYTVNGAAPDCGSPILTTGKFPAVFTADTTVKAIACKKNYVPSDVVTASYSNAACRGNFKVQNRAQLEALSHCKRIEGSLDIKSTQDVVDLAPLRQLQRVDGVFFVTANSGLTSLDGLEALTGVGGELAIASNGALSSLRALKSLRTTGYLTVSGNRILKSLNGLEALTTADGEVVVHRNEALTSLDALSSLQAAIGLDIQNNAVTEWIGPSSLTSLYWIYIENEKALTHVGGFSGLKEIRNSLYVNNNEKLSVFDAMPALTTLGGAAFFDNVSLREISGFANVRQLRKLSLRSKGLTRFRAFSQLTQISAVSVELCPDLTVLELSSLGSVGGLSFANVPALPSLQGLSALTEVTDDGIDLRGVLGFANLRGLEHVTTLKGRLSIQGTTGFFDLQGLSSVTTVQYLSASQNTHLRSLRGLDKLTKMMSSSSGDSISLQENAALIDIGTLNALSDAPGRIVIERNPRLTRLNGVHGLTSAGGLSIRSNPALAKLDGLDALVHVKGPLDVSDNGLTTLEDLHSLEDVTGSLQIAKCSALSNLDGLRALRSVGSDLLVSDNASLASFGLPQMTTLGGSSCTVVRNPKLPSCQPYAVVKRIGYGGHVDIRENDETTSCN